MTNGTGTNRPLGTRVAPICEDGVVSPVRHDVLHCFNDWLDGEEDLLAERRERYVATYATPNRKVVQQ